MLSDQEAQALWDRGERREAFPFVTGEVEVPGQIRDLATRPGAIDWQQSRVLKDTRQSLDAVADDARRSLSARIAVDQIPEVYDFWRKTAAPFAAEWLDRLARYFADPGPKHTGQLIRYRTGDYFRLHNDAGWFPPDVYRVAMIAVGLTPLEDYEGGELCFPSEGEHGVFRLGLGDVLVFPAAMRHEVREVTRGERIVVLGYYQSPMSDAHYGLYVDQFDRELSDG